jgi:hypothetical protein
MVDSAYCRGGVVGPSVSRSPRFCRSSGRRHCGADRDRSRVRVRSCPYKGGVGRRTEGDLSSGGCAASVIGAPSCLWATRRMPTTHNRSASQCDSCDAASALRHTASATPVSSSPRRSTERASKLPVAYVIGLRDRTQHASVTSPLRLRDVSATPAVSSFRGYWARDNNVASRHIGWLPTSAEPPAPPNQGRWQNPCRDLRCNGSRLGAEASRLGATSWICSSH